jgi:cell division septal protein FtsQ
MRRAYYGHSRSEYKKRQKRRSKKRDWHRSEFNNPYFTKPQTINLKLYVYFLLVSTLIVFLSYIFLVYDYWNIDSITIRTQNKSYQEKIQNIIDHHLNSRVFNILNGANYFLFSVNEVKDDIENQLLVKDLEVDKKLPNKLVVNLQEIKAAYIWIQAGKFYNIDDEGMILDEIISIQRETAKGNPEESEDFNLEGIKRFLMHSTANLDLPIIYNDGNFELKSRNYISNKNIFELINNLNNKVGQYINNDIILYRIDSSNFKKIEIFTEPGWKIYFDAEKELTNQLENLYTLMQTTFQDAEPAEYIDLRYGNKVYYK